MAAKYLHVVSFNVPFPADYGGIIDIYYKIAALKQAGIQVILHCFQYGRQPSKELEDLCFKVFYYPRKQGLRYFFSSSPYIVTTRNAKSMPKHLLGDSFPVLFEGLHTTGLLTKCHAAHKKTLVRAHNIEHSYYLGLAKSEPGLSRKLFLRSEAKKLKQYEPVLKQADHILGIAKHETAYFNQRYGNAVFIPPFHRFEEVTSLPGTGQYILLHGNLGVSENSEVILSLVDKVLSKNSLSVIIAGKNPSERFLRRMSRFKQIEVIANPTDEQLDQLIHEAHINLLYTYQSTGVKLKLIHALYAGRFCLVNRKMVHGTGLESLCTLVDDQATLPPAIEKLMETPFKESQIAARKKVLKDYSNRTGAEKILRLLS